MEKVLTVTGYKSYELNINSAKDKKIIFIKEALKKQLIRFIENGGEWVLSSGQVGVELWVLEVVIQLKKQYPIKYAIIPPFDQQHKRWPEHDQALYEQLIKDADFYQLLYQGDYKGPHQFKMKNTWLITKSDASLILVDEDFPASVRYYLTEAKQAQANRDYPIYYITPFDLDEIIREWNENNDNLSNQ